MASYLDRKTLCIPVLNEDKETTYNRPPFRDNQGKEYSKPVIALVDNGVDREHLKFDIVITDGKNYCN